MVLGRNTWNLRDRPNCLSHSVIYFPPLSSVEDRYPGKHGMELDYSNWSVLGKVAGLGDHQLSSKEV